MALLKASFCEEDFLQDENLRSMIGGRRLCTVPFLKALLLEKLDFSGVVLVVLIQLLKEIGHFSGTFLIL
jgi:hypothetical protein